MPGKKVWRVGLTLCLVALLCAPSLASAADIKELKVAIGVDADTLDPIEQTTTLIQNICDLIYDTLIFQTPDGKLEPRLVTKWDISPDGLTYTLQVRQGVFFHDGTEVTAEAVKLGFDRALDPQKKASLAFAIKPIDKVIAKDKYTVELKLKHPYAPLMPFLSMTLTTAVSPAYVAKDEAALRTKPVGAGPYKLQEWVKGDRIVLVRNDKYYGPKPTVEKILFKIVPEAATREAMLRTGQMDICYKPLPSNVAALQADKSLKVEMPMSTRTIFMGLNCQKGVTTNKLVRQAFNYAVDKKAIVEKILFNTAAALESPLSPIMNGATKMATQYDYNPDKAKALLKQANFDFSKTVAMRTPNGRYLFDKQIAEAIQAYLQAIGVKTELRVFDWPTYVAGLLKPIAESELEVFLLGWGPLTLDPDMALVGQFTCGVNPPNGLGSAFYCQAEYDKLMDASRREQDPKKRAEIFQQGTKMIWDDCPWLWLHAEKFVLAYSAKIKGLVVTPTEKFYPTYITMN